MPYNRTHPPKKRTRKIRPPIRVKDRVAKRGGKCHSCRVRYEKGDTVTVVTVKRRTYHSGCVPANASSVVPGTVGAGGVVTANPIGTTPEAVVESFSDRWTPGEAKLVALAALENTLVVIGRKLNFPKEFEDAYTKYMKLKGHCLRPSNSNENRQAFLVAVRKLVDTVFTPDI